MLSVRGTKQVVTSADHREHRMLSDTRQRSSVKQTGACPDSNWQTRHATLNLTRCQMVSQWSSHRTGMIWPRHRVPVISRVVAFCNCTIDESRPILTVNHKGSWDDPILQAVAVSQQMSIINLMVSCHFYRAACNADAV